ncbi:3-hydroxybenzoate 6-hydroxylase [Seminavis robusta]|uniref:3-hydroxybenzoate 6-hydroxylase n=1 Tax=Seminavis robusta TaxID=568900 RepID=A0A9N8DTR3_9STRA|nr:3-hydroxybenzoate 6-hydroxylase [Seminavis robusta]|eukprot:Sro364_g127260.1 3-hydroxybenzoate 6-hydroxylase (373) ;mRNA; r:67424-68789
MIEWRQFSFLLARFGTVTLLFHFCKATKDVVVRDDGLVDVLFEDGSQRTTQLLFGCDGAHSKVREVVAGDATSLEYTGVTCLMGIAENCPIQQEGISFPSSHTTGCHSVYFPTGPNEQCFQVHWPIPVEQANSGNWGNLTDTMSKQECQALAKRLEQDGWHPRFIEPLNHVTHAVRVGFALMKPSLKKWSYGKNKRVVLVGDAAHPPVPYIGQGAQMGIEDAGTMAWLLKKLCVDSKGNFTLENFGKAVELYEKIRIPRTSHISECSEEMGKMQELRGDVDARDSLEFMIQGEVMMNGALPIMFQGVSHHYQKSVDRELRKFELEEQRNAVSVDMPGVLEPSDAERKRNAQREEEEMREAFEAMMYGTVAGQ